MTTKINADTAIALRGDPVEGCSAGPGCRRCRSGTRCGWNQRPAEAARRVSDFLSGIPKVEDPDVAGELLDYYNRVVEDGQYSMHMLGFPEEVAEKVGVPISSRAADFLKSIDPAKLMDTDGIDTHTPPAYTLGPDGLPLNGRATNMAAS